MIRTHRMRCRHSWDQQPRAQETQQRAKAANRLAMHRLFTSNFIPANASSAIGAKPKPIQRPTCDHHNSWHRQDSTGPMPASQAVVNVTWTHTPLLDSVQQHFACKASPHATSPIHASPRLRPLSDLKCEASCSEALHQHHAHGCGRREHTTCCTARLLQLLLLQHKAQASLQNHPAGAPVARVALVAAPACIHNALQRLIHSAEPAQVLNRWPAGLLPHARNTLQCADEPRQSSCSEVVHSIMAAAG